VRVLGWMGLVLVSCESIWLVPMLTGLTLVDIAVVRTRTLRGLGALLLAMGLSG
jgi:hypothetical protein